MKDDFLVFGTNEVIDNMGGRGVSTRIAEPLGANEALHDGCWVVNSTVTRKNGSATEKSKLAPQIVPAGVGW